MIDITKFDIKAIEELVDEMCDCYDHPEQELVDKMNQLTGRDWDAEDCWMYTCEYWSHHSLEETVFALITGEYPVYKECEYFFWTENCELEDSLEETALFFRLGRYRDNKRKFNKFDDMPLDDIYKWLEEKFSSWKKHSFEHEDDRNSLTFSMDVEYAVERKVHLFPYKEKCLRLSLTNIEEEMQEEIVDYMKQFSTEFLMEE